MTERAAVLRGSIPGRQRVVVGLAIGLWVSQYAWFTLNQSLMDWRGGWELAGRRVLTCLFGVVLCLLIGKAFARLRHWPPWRKAASVIVLGFLGALIWSASNQLLALLIYREQFESVESTLVSLLLNSVTLLWVFVAWGGAWQAIDYGSSLAERERQLARIRALEADARHQMLRYQLNPHFMFNTLNAIASLIGEREPDKAERVVLNLSKFLRASLERSPQEKVTVVEEVAVMRDYLAIEQVRFEDRLAIRIAVDEAASGCLVPSFILQPLVENAIKYAVSQSPAPVALEIEARVQGGRLALAVRDDGPGSAAKGVATLGVGLQNVRQRLDLLYGEAAAISAANRPGGGFEARIELPAETGEG